MNYLGDVLCAQRWNPPLPPGQPQWQAHAPLPRVLLKLAWPCRVLWGFLSVSKRPSPKALATQGRGCPCRVGGAQPRPQALSPRRPPVFQQPVIFLGADVTHPPAGDGKKPSIAAVSAALSTGPGQGVGGYSLDGLDGQLFLRAARLLSGSGGSQVPWERRWEALLGVSTTERQHPASRSVPTSRRCSAGLAALGQTGGLMPYI